MVAPRHERAKSSPWSRCGSGRPGRGSSPAQSRARSRTAYLWHSTATSDSWRQPQHKQRNTFRHHPVPNPEPWSSRDTARRPNLEGMRPCRTLRWRAMEATRHPQKVLRSSPLRGIPPQLSRNVGKVNECSYGGAVVACARTVTGDRCRRVLIRHEAQRKVTTRQ